MDISEWNHSLILMRKKEKQLSTESVPIINYTFLFVFIKFFFFFFFCGGGGGGGGGGGNCDWL